MQTETKNSLTMLSLDVTNYMKYLLLYFFTICPVIICAQNSKIKEIQFEGIAIEENSYTEILKLKDQNALIIQIGYSSYPIRVLDSDVIVYLNNGKVELYKITESVENEVEAKVKKVKIKKNNYLQYWSFLNTCITQKKFNIDKAKLNFEDKENSTLALATSGGQTYHFNVYQNKKYINYSSFAPKISISQKYPGFEEKQRLVDLMEGFEDIIN